jgi:hypothetical protein
MLELGSIDFFLLAPGCLDRSPGKCCAQPAHISLDMAYITRPSRNTVHRANRSVGQQTSGRTGLILRTLFPEESVVQGLSVIFFFVSLDSQDTVEIQKRHVVIHIIWTSKRPGSVKKLKGEATILWQPSAISLS